MPDEYLDKPGSFYYEDGWYKPVPIELAKLDDYISIVLNYREIVDGVTSYI
jgi:hypothetical protein